MFESVGSTIHCDSNCEMFVNRMLTGQSVSPQVQRIGGILIVATLITMIARSLAQPSLHLLRREAPQDLIYGLDFSV